MKIFGIFGYPLKHTLSPAMQNAAFRKWGIDAAYLALELDPHSFREVAKRFRETPLRGFNVTIPYKEAVIPYLAKISPEASVIGAVNTVKRYGNEFRGFNTDVYGFRRALRETGMRIAGKKAVILGAGGASRACVAGLYLEKAKSVSVLNAGFDFERARNLKRHFSKYLKRFPVSIFRIERTALKRELEDAEVLINATSLGLKKEDPVLIRPEFLPRKKMLVFDVIYKPAETPLLRLARLKGHRTLNGLSMLLHQGARSFEIWTGKRAPVALMREELRAGLEGEK